MLEDWEETYDGSPDGFSIKPEEQSKETLDEYARVSYPDMKNVDFLKRQKEEQKILTSQKGVINTCSDEPTGDVYTMVTVSENFAIALKDATASRKEIKEDIKKAYFARLEKATSRLQIDIIVRECKSRIRIEPDEGPFYKDFISSCILKREQLPLPTDLEDQAETPAAILRAKSELNVPVERTDSERPRFIIKKLSGGNRFVVGSKHRKKTTSFQYHFELTKVVQVHILPVRNKECPLWERDSILYTAYANIKVAVWDTIVCFADQYYDGKCWKTRVRLFKPITKKTLLEKEISDDYHKLGPLLGVDMTVNNAFVLLYGHHVVVAHSDSVPFVICFEKQKESLCTAITMLPETLEVAIGTFDGSVYIHDGKTGLAMRFMDMPLKIPVLGLRAVGPLLFAHDAYCAIRFHPDTTTVAPYVFQAGYTMNVAACGTLLTCLNDTGMIWIINTFVQGNSRQIYPPEAISTKFFMGEKKTNEDFVWKLNVPVTYLYSAIYMGRTFMHVLYPSGMVRKINWE